MAAPSGYPIERDVRPCRAHVGPKRGTDDFSAHASEEPVPAFRSPHRGLARLSAVRKPIATRSASYSVAAVGRHAIVAHPHAETFGSTLDTALVACMLFSHSCYGFRRGWFVQQCLFVSIWATKKASVLVLAATSLAEIGSNRPMTAMTRQPITVRPNSSFHLGARKRVMRVAIERQR